MCISQVRGLKMDSNNVARWEISPHARSTMGVDGGVLLDIEKGLCYSLNLVGAKIWLAIESGNGETSFAHIVNALGPQFPREQLVRDIDEYLRDLEKKGLIKAAGGV